MSSNDTNKRGEEMKITVKAARVSAGLTKKDVAKELNLSVTGYTRKEEGENRFYVDEAVKLSQMLNLDLDYFFGRQCHNKTRSEQEGAERACN